MARALEIQICVRHLQPLIRVLLAEFTGTDFHRGVLFYTGDEVLPFRVEGHTFHALPVGLLERAH